MSTVSVIIAAHNAAQFLGQAVDSALVQSCPPLEIIVVDDGSTDGTDRVARAYGDRVTFLRQDNAGAASARNAGARRASGDWLAFLDADDVWLPEKLERQLALSDAPLVYSDRFNIGVLDGLPDIHGKMQPPIDGDVFVALLIKGNVITTSSVMIRADVFRTLGGFDPGLMVAEDWDLWLRVAADRPVRACREPLVKYRLHPAGASRNPLRMNRARCVVVDRALRSPRGRSLSMMTRRQIWAETYRTNGWDASRHRERRSALLAYARAIVFWPFKRDAYVGVSRVLRGG
jgi:glycosyltransferase involved in cell wall biosynthesis